jgi:hypothetical protein
MGRRGCMAPADCVTRWVEELQGTAYDGARLVTSSTQPPKRSQLRRQYRRVTTQLIVIAQ